MVQAVSAVGCWPSRRALAGLAWVVALTRGGQCSSSTLAPSFPASSPKVAGAFRSCSSHTRAPSHHSLARPTLASWCLLPLLPFFFTTTCTFKRLWPSRSLCASPFFDTTTHLSSIGFKHEPSTPISSFNNTKVSHLHHRHRRGHPSTSMATLHHQVHHSKHRRNTNAILRHMLAIAYPYIATRCSEDLPSNSSLTAHQLSTTR